MVCNNSEVASWTASVVPPKRPACTLAGTAKPAPSATPALVAARPAKPGSFPNPTIGKVSSTPTGTEAPNAASSFKAETSSPVRSS